MTDPQGTKAHRPTADGRCEHRWRNRTTHAVRCGWADGYREAVAEIAALRAALDEFDGSVCPACHHSAHDPGSCEWCPRCELHTDEALAFVLRSEPELVRAALAKEASGS